MKKLLLLFYFSSLFGISTAQKSVDKSIEVKQRGKNYDTNFLNLKKSSKKDYYFNPKGLITSIVKYGRHHYAYLKVIGQKTNYNYQGDLVIEIDSNYCCQDDENINISADTLTLQFITKKYLYDTKFNVYDSSERLLQSANDFSEVKKYKYKASGLISKINYYYSDSDQNLDKKGHLIFKWSNVKGLSKETIERLNNFILWQHELGI